MAVEVLDYQGFSNLRSEADVDEAVMVHLQSMQNLVTLLAKQPSKQQDFSLLAESDATISDLKKLITLLGGSGHARFRHGPAAPHSSQGQHVSNEVRSSSAPHDAVQTKQVSGIVKQPNSSCSPFKHMDVVMHNTSIHDASPITLGTQKEHVFQPFSSCSPSKNNASQMSCIPSMDRLNSCVPQLCQSCSPCKEGNRYKNHSNLHVSGHARCRDSTVQKHCHQDSAVSTQKNMPCQLKHCAELKTDSSFLSSLSMDGEAGTVSNGKPVISSGRPPLPPKKRKSPENTEDRTIKCRNSVNCHCAKRRKLKTRRILRVSSMGLSNGDIPADGYTWCIYGEKLSKDSSQPRVYYKCSSVRGCPARKHVQRASDDPNTLIVTYGREHLHPQIHKVMMTSE